ncbi:MAG TPA: hypothetical protein VN673_13660 [Clostridia bacterium]|nr:hypothetical protein [Clostridia bacterium]
MSARAQGVSKLKILRAWALSIGFLGLVAGFFLWRNAGTESSTDVSFDPGRLILSLVFGGIILVGGIVAYAVVLFSDCFTYNFSQPVWKPLKRKIYLANLIAPLGWAVGLGVIIGGVATPILASYGLDPAVAGLLPILGTVAVVQVAQFWILVWAPLERSVIHKRLKAQGITDAQLQGALLVGISNPAQSSLKKFYAIEDDVGGLWITPAQIIYWGDSERMAFTPLQVQQLERRGDAGSTTMLSGVAHVILHVTQPAGDTRQIRFHTEGIWTMGQKRRTMDTLAKRLEVWLAAPPPVPAASAQTTDPASH